MPRRDTGPGFVSGRGSGLGPGAGGAQKGKDKGNKGGQGKGARQESTGAKAGKGADQGGRGKGGKPKGKGGGGKGSGVAQVISKIDRDTRHLTQQFTMVIANMAVAADLWATAESTAEVIKNLPRLVCEQLRVHLEPAAGSTVGVPGIGRALAALDQALAPEAIVAVHQQGAIKQDGMVTLKLHIRKNRADVAATAGGIVTQIISPALWGLDAPYSIFMDGSPKPEGERGLLKDDPGEAALGERLTWALATLAAGWTEELARRWWQERAEKSGRPDRLYDEVQRGVEEKDEGQDGHNDDLGPVDEDEAARTQRQSGNGQSPLEAGGVEQAGGAVGLLLLGENTGTTDAPMGQVPVEATQGGVKADVDAAEEQEAREKLEEARKAATAA